MITRYDSEVEDITFETPEETIARILGTSAGAGGKTPMASYSPSDLRLLWRAGRITEDEWRAELEARGNSSQAATDEIANQKTVGVSTAASTRGQLTASEAASVAAYKASAP